MSTEFYINLVDRVLRREARTAESGDIFFRIEDYGVFVIENRGNPWFFRLIRPGYANESENISFARLLEEANFINSEMRGVKCTVGEGEDFLSVNLEYGAWLSEPDTFPSETSAATALSMGMEVILHSVDVLQKLNRDGNLGH